MQETEQIISLYHTGFMICLGLAVIFTILSIIFFFKFDIRKVFDFRTGRGERRIIRQMEEENAKTGKLRNQDSKNNETEELYRTSSGNVSPVIYPTTKPTNTGTGVTDSIGTNGTATTVNDDAEGNVETEVLESTRRSNESGSMETTVLTPEMEAAMKAEVEAKENTRWHFEIVKENIWIHTEETI